MRRSKWYPVCLLALLVSASVVACETVPITGRSQILLLPESEELQMGLQSYQEVLKKSKVSTDPAMNDLVKRVGTRIAAATGRSDYQWEFKVIEEQQANAFYLPGGKVAVYTGILPVPQDDALARRAVEWFRGKGAAKLQIAPVDSQEANSGQGGFWQDAKDRAGSMWDRWRGATSISTCGVNTRPTPLSRGNREADHQSRTHPPK